MQPLWGSSKLCIFSMKNSNCAAAAGSKKYAQTVIIYKRLIKNALREILFAGNGKWNISWWNPHHFSECCPVFTGVELLPYGTLPLIICHVSMQISFHWLRYRHSILSLTVGCCNYRYNYAACESPSNWYCPLSRELRRSNPRRKVANWQFPISVAPSSGVVFMQIMCVCVCVCFFPMFSIEFLWQFIMDWHFGIVLVILGQQLPKTTRFNNGNGGCIGVWCHNLHV